MPSEDPQDHSGWSVETWDRIGYWILGAFGVYVFFSSVIAAVVIMLFGFLALMIYGAYKDPTQ